jgi:hypothetical protein
MMKSQVEQLALLQFADLSCCCFKLHAAAFRGGMVCRKNKDGERDSKEHKRRPFIKVVEITPPPRCLGGVCDISLFRSDFFLPCMYGGSGAGFDAKPTRRYQS